MSGRTVPRFMMVGLLVGAFAAPALAQQPTPEAPMPRPKPISAIEIELSFGTGTGILGGESVPAMAPPVAPELPVAPMTAPTPPNFLVEAGTGLRLSVPALGPLPLSFDLAIPQQGDRLQGFNFGIGLFGSESSPPRPTGLHFLAGGCGVGSSFTCAPGAPAPRPLPQLSASGPGLLIVSGFEHRPVPACVPLVQGSTGLSCAPSPRYLERTGPAFTCGNAARFQLVSADDAQMYPPTCPPCPLPQITVNPLLGTWYRELPGTVISATFTHDELKLCLTQSADGHTMTMTVTTHYTVTKDGLVFGAITGADADLKSDSKTGDSSLGMDLADLSTTMQTYVDAPFSFRTKMTSAGLMVSGLKCGGPLRHSEAEMFGGMFKSAKDGRVPAPVALKTPGAPRDRYRVALPPGEGIQAPGQTIERVGVDFEFDLPVRGPIAQPKPQPARPVGYGVPTDATKQLATEAFGQLLQQSGVMQPAGGMTLPSPYYLQHFPQYFATDPAFPLPRELVAQEDPQGAARRSADPLVCAPAPLRAGAVGTWYRDIAGKQCVVKVSPDHLTLTVHDAQEIDGKVSVASLVITADYHMTRDGITAVGLITSVDVSFEGDFPAEDTKPFFEMLTELQKALEDKPFALTFRIYGDSLVIGNVRVPSVGDHMDVQPAGYLSGRYKAAGDKLPKPKPVKGPIEPKVQGGFGPPPQFGYPVPTGTGPIILPPGSAYPQPQYIAPPPPAPGANSDLLPPQSLPAPRVIPSSGSVPAAPTMSEPVPLVPQMPQPIPPADDRSEGLKQMYHEWRRFWFNDLPSHLTPERIHGGIY